MTMITPSYLGETIEYSSLHACRSTLEDPTAACTGRTFPKNGCTLYLPTGVYITTGLALRSYINLKGDGWGTSVIQLKPHTASDVLSVPADAFNFSVYGITVDGDSTRGGVGNCLYVAPTSTGPAEWNTANKGTPPVNAQKWGHIEEVMFSNCSADGIHINAYNYMLFFDNFYAFNNGVYGLYIQGTNSGFANFQIERNGTAGIHVDGSNDRFISGEVIWNGSAVSTEAGMYVSGYRNITMRSILKSTTRTCSSTLALTTSSLAASRIPTGMFGTTQVHRPELQADFSSRV